MKTMKNTPVIVLRPIITFLSFSLFFFLPQLIIEFNYSVSVFLCFLHFLANRLRIPTISSLLKAANISLPAWNH